MANASAGRRKNFDILQEGIFNLYVEDNLDLLTRQAASIMQIYDVARYDYSYSSGYFHLCTAFGKSYLIKAMAMSYNSMQSGKKIIILEENQTVVEQMVRELTVNSSLRSSDVGAFYAKSKDVDTPVIVCTYASMKKMIERVGRENIGLVLCDEAHHILSENRQNVAKEFGDCALYGFTATSDYGIQDKNCAAVFGPVIDSVTIRDGIERDGLLCSTKTGLFLSNIAVDLTRAIGPGHEDYDPKILDELLHASHVDGLRRGLADWYLYGFDETIGKVFGKQTIINVPSIAEAERVAHEFNTAAAEKGLEPIAHAYHTKTSDSVLDEFNVGKFPVLIQVNKISEGYNNPNVAICINYPTHSLVRSIQRSGRALRFDPKNPDKVALVMDVAFVRRAPDEAGTDVLTQIYDNGQRLFYESMGTVQCWNPSAKYVRGDGNGQNKDSQPRDVVELPSVFRVVTSTEFTHMVIEHETNDSNIELKTSEWLTAKELSGKYIVAEPRKIREALEKYQKDMPNGIQLKRSGTHVAPCLNINEIDDFCKLSKLKRMDVTIGEKTSEWLTAGDLSAKYIIGSASKVLRALEQYADQMPNAILHKRISGQTPLCLNIHEIDNFCELSGLKRKRMEVNVGEKTSEWLNARELAGKYLVGTSTKVLRALEKYADKMPNAIQLRRNGTRTRGVLCLNINEIDEFCKLSGLEMMDVTIGEKTSEWLSVTDLRGKYISGPGPNILRTLEKYADKMPNAIQRKRISGQTPLCLNIHELEHFCDLSGLECLDVMISKKTSEWLNAQELAGKYISAPIPKILLALKEYADKMPNAIQRKLNGKRRPLCLNINNVDLFCEVSGLKRADNTIAEKTPEWLTAGELSGKYIVGRWQKILPLLERYRSQMPNGIQLRRSGAHVAPCLNINEIDEFCKLSGLVRKSGEFRSGNKKVDALNALQTVKHKTKSGDSHGM